MERCSLWLTKEEIEPERLKGATVVVIDVLLATTTLVTIMERGARRVLPVESMEEAHHLKSQLDPSTTLTGGEQGGKAVDEFDCSHLLDDYMPERVKDKDIIFLSTNGTRAIKKVQNAQKIILANLRNVNAVADYLNRESTENLYIICSGASGHFSMEDYVCASLILSQLHLENVKLNDAAMFALEQEIDLKEKLRELIAKGRVGHNTLKLGLENLFEFTVDVGASNSIIGVNQEGELYFLSVGSEVR
ncbi:2-phosphosulfolactate phosphatase [Alteribacillus sp. YIM 98480]|uniref:2-phosphosulfolactate phosphatase n=1 Tax=Alteribacillus sp. YIM 98480 TaxID=2606599 RepID=UPI00131C43FA|nr:2-phosphosulfolactate phosphatase [Alteribacillus sp. YIM 98480]